MARIRSIKPGFFLNDVLAELPPLDRILFAGLWTLADREGRLEDRIRKIKAEILPYDDHDTDAALTRLADKNFILRYEVKGCKYIQILNFLKHQCPNIKEHDSIIPAPYKNGMSTPRLRKGKEGSSIGKEQEQEGKGKEQDIVEQVVSHLNTVLETDYKPQSKKTREMITARLNQGFILENFKVVIDKKTRQWRGDPKMCAYLRPETLFGPKFESYLNERETQGASHGSNQGHNQTARTAAGGIRGDASIYDAVTERFNEDTGSG